MAYIDKIKVGGVDYDIQDTALKNTFSSDLLFSNVNKIIVQQGLYAVANGQPSDSPSWCRCDFLWKNCNLKTTTILMYLLAYNIDGTFVGWWNGTEFGNANLSVSFKNIDILSWTNNYPNYKFRINFYKGTTFTPSDVYSELVIKDGYNEEIKNNKTDINTNCLRSYNLLLSTAERWGVFNSDCDGLIPNKIYSVAYSTNISHIPYSGFYGYIMSVTGVTADNTSAVQLAFKPDGTDMMYRVKWMGNWSQWTGTAQSFDEEFYSSLWKTFHTVGIIGDSLASGACYSNEGGSNVEHDLYQYSWGQCMARDSGNTFHNFSRGGLTAKEWMTDQDYGYPVASQQSNICDAYIIGLGVNDSGTGVTVGSSSDIDFSNPDNNNDTFYGNYAKIIQKMKIIAPKAPIFVVTKPTTPLTDPYQQAIEDMANLFENVYVLNLYEYVNYYYDANSIIRKSLRAGHYNAIAYEVMSKIIERALNSVMLANVDNFMQIEFINTNYSWTDT